MVLSKDHSPEEGLSDEGRQWAKHPELKPKPKPEGRGRAFAIAHLDELLHQAEKKEQAQRRVGCERYQLLCGCLSRLGEVP